MELDVDLKAIQEVRDLLRAAARAQEVLAGFCQEEVDRVVEAMAGQALEHARDLAELAVQETGFGRVEDKVVKNTFAAQNIAASLRGMKTVGVIRSDEAKKVYEIAVPMGIVAAIIPSTNPTSTTVFKALISLKARNAVIFSPHPAAKECIGRTAALLHDAARRAGAPDGIIGCLTQPTMEATQELMRHPLTSVILATGGHGLVKAAYSSGKPAFGVGPGNVPAFIERTADVAQAVQHVLAGKCFDNGTICASEQAMVVDLPLDAAVRAELRRLQAHFCSPVEKKQLAAFMVPGGRLNPAVVGRPAQVIAQQAGFSVAKDTTALIVELNQVGPVEPLSMEKLSPVLAYYTVDGWREGCERCIEILNYGGLGHSMVIHSTDAEIIMRFAMEKPAFRILVNTPGTHGAIGYSTSLTPSLTLGCGTAGGNITTDNLTARHLVNIRRLAYGIRPVLFTRGETLASAEKSPAAGTDRVKVRELVKAALEQVLATTPPQGPPPTSPPASLERPAPPKAEAGAPMDFVSEADVRSALAEGRKIRLTSTATVTPLARELGEAGKVFERE